MEKDGKFEYTYSAPTEDERREIESIKRQYVSEPKPQSKIEQLRNLNKRVNNPPLTVGIILGVIGVLVFGLGMTMGLKWNILVWGAVVGVAGIGITVAAYFIYKAMLIRNKRKYGNKIIELSNELLNENIDTDKSEN